MSGSTISMQSIRVTAFDWVPGFAQGHVRDLRVRWALEEAGLSYEEIILPQGTQGERDNLRRQPFGQIPAVEMDGETMFESGAIVWTIAERSGDALLPVDAGDRRQCLSWVFGALNTLEPRVSMAAILELFVKDRDAADRLAPEIDAMIRQILGRIHDALGSHANLVGERFTIADLLMTTVLRDVPAHVLQEFDALRDYVEDHSSRPAFRAALAAQLEPFRANAPRYEGEASNPLSPSGG